MLNEIQKRLRTGMEGDDGLYLRHAGFKQPADRIGLEFLREERMQRFGNHFHSGVG